LSTSDGLALVGAFSKIGDAKLRKVVVELVEQIARAKGDLA
jgi:hypothetical protein